MADTSARTAAASSPRASTAAIASFPCSHFFVSFVSSFCTSRIFLLCTHTHTRNENLEQIAKTPERTDVGTYATSSNCLHYIVSRREYDDTGGYAARYRQSRTAYILTFSSAAATPASSSRVADACPAMSVYSVLKLQLQNTEST